MKSYFFRFIPPEQHETAGRFLLTLRRVVGGYVRGQTVTSAIIAVYTMTVMFAAGVPNAAAYGVLAGFADIIPLIGAFIAIIPAVVAAFQESPTQALIVLGALLAYQQFEDRYLVPKIYGQTLNLPPIVVLIAVLVGGELMGITGILLALPAAAAGRVVVDEYLERRLPVPQEPEEPEADVLAPDEEPVPEAPPAPPA
jgi:predicted PurR-regulated permease PerM